MTFSFLSGLGVLEKNLGLFDTFAIDVFLDKNLKPYILEINQPFAVEGADLPGYRDVLP